MSDLQALSRARTIAVTTIRRDGTAVTSPVWFAVDGDVLHVVTAAASGKVKRIRNNPAVTVAACTRLRGRPTGPAVAGTARVVPIDEAPGAHRLVTERYGAQSRFFQWRNRRRGIPMTMLEIRLAAPTSSPPAA